MLCHVNWKWGQTILRLNSPTLQTSELHAASRSARDQRAESSVSEFQGPAAASKSYITRCCKACMRCCGAQRLWTRKQTRPPMSIMDKSGGKLVWLCKTRWKVCWRCWVVFKAGLGTLGPQYKYSLFGSCHYVLVQYFTVSHNVVPKPNSTDV